MRIGTRRTKFMRAQVHLDCGSLDEEKAIPGMRIA
jgi:hypothetical protein